MVLSRVSVVEAEVQPTDLPVYTDDSPEAWEIFARARDQIRKDNLAEAVRLYQHLLDEFGSRLMSRSRTVAAEPGANAADDDNDLTSSMHRFVSVRSRVHQALLEKSEILRLYQETNEPAAQRQIDEGDFEAVFISRFLTPSGLQAAFALAEGQIRRAHFHSALRILHEAQKHPEFENDGHPIRWARLTALAGLFADNEFAYAEAVEILHRTEEGEGTIERLAELASAIKQNEDVMSAVVHPFGSLDKPTLNEVQPLPVWRFEFTSGPDDALQYRALSPHQRQEIREDSEIGMFANVAPTACQDKILASDGISIVALDRFDGHERWRYPESNALHALEKVQLRRGGVDRGSGELSVVATNGLVAIARIFQPTETQLGRRTLNEIVCVDVETGRPMWSVIPSDIDPTFFSATFHGSPTLASGRVYAIVRTSRQRLASEYLVCLDLPSGDVQWSRYLVSSATARSGINATPKLPLVHRGVVYVASPFGCYAAIDAATGIPLWVELESPDAQLAEYSTRTLRAWETDRPVMTEFGLLCINPNYDEVVLLDSDTGTQRAQLNVGGLESIRYLVANNNSVFGVGDEVYRLDKEKLREQLDRLAANSPGTALLIDEPWIPVFAPMKGERIFGRISAGDEHLILPTDHNLFLVDTTDGRVLERASHAAPGTPLVIHGEVVIATNEGIDSYMPYTLAEPRLRARMAAAPDDPGPAISLVRLAGRHHQFADIIPAADDAIDAITFNPLSERNRRLQGQLFRTLLELVDDPALADAPGVGRRSSTSLDVSTNERNSIAEDLFVRLDLIASTVSQRLDYLFSFGSFQTREGRPNAAVDAYQQILTTPSLSSAMLSTDDRRVRARNEATARLSELVDSHGSSIYALHEQAARNALDRALRDGGRDPAALLAIALEYPMAAAASEACLEAGRLFAQMDQPHAAIASWRLGVSLAPENMQESKLLSYLVRALEAQGAIDEVFRELRTAERRNSTASLIEPDGTTISIPSWRSAFIARLDPGDRFPRIDDFADSAVKIQKGDELLLPLVGRPSSSIALVRLGRELSAYGGPNAELMWEQSIDRADTSLLKIEGDEAVLWGADRRVPKYIQKLSLTDGRTLWQTDIESKIEEDPDPDAGQVRDFDRRSRRIGRSLTAVGPDEVVFAMTSGEVVCIDDESGDVLWSHRALLPEITDIAVDPFGVVVAGHRNLDENDLSPTLLVLDRASGNQISAFDPPSQSSFQWMISDGAGKVVASMMDAIVAYDLFMMEERWVLDGINAAVDEEPAAGGSHIFVADADDALLMIEFATGRTTSVPSINLGDSSASSLRVYPWHGQFVLKSSSGVYVFEDDGSRTGELARSGSANLSISAVAPTADRAAVIEGREDDRSRTRRQLVMYQVDRTGKRITGEIYPNASLPKINMAQAIDDWVLIDVGSHVLFFHAPASGSGE